MKEEISVKEQIKKIFENLFINNKIDYFIGGSERFGYKTDQSDIDFFIFDPNIIKIDKILFQLPFNTYIRKNPLMGLGYDLRVNIQFELFGGLIHLNIIELKNQFEELKEEHNKIEKMLNKNHELFEFIHTIKNKSISNIDGKTVYRIMKEIINKKERI